MAQSAEEVLDQHWKNVDIYNVKAEWEHMDRELDHIWDICSRRGYPDAAHEQQRCRCAKGKVARRQGRYEDAEACLLEALSLRVDKDIRRPGRAFYRVHAAATLPEGQNVPATTT
jgi:hypothetical protein